MNKNKVALLAAITLSAAGLAFSTANAADTATTVDTGKAKAPCASNECGPGRGGGFMKDLGITTDQLEKMNTLKLSFENAIGPKKEELRSLHRELRDDMTKPGISKSELLTLQSKINGVRDELSNSRINFMADKIALLTDDQRAKIREFSLKFNMGPGGHHSRHGHHGFNRKGKFHHGDGKPGPRSFGGDDKAFGGDGPAFGDDAPGA